MKKNGAWDYKVSSDYGPYNKKWSMVLKNSIAVHTAEWFGNYNYGFIGKVLFSLSELKGGSQLVSLVWSHKLDDAEDTSAITVGYGES